MYHVADSLCCTAGTTQHCKENYTPVKINFKNKFKRNIK